MYRVICFGREPKYYDAIIACRWAIWKEKGFSAALIQTARGHPLFLIRERDGKHAGGDRARLRLCPPKADPFGPRVCAK